MDSHFPEAHCVTEFERCDRHIDKLRRSGECIDYVSICSPNYLHDAHVRFALRSDSDAICEKPLVLNPWNVDGLAEIEAGTGRRINTILQLRLHPAIIALKQKVEVSDRRHTVDLSYVTSRGQNGRASCRERLFQYVQMSVVAVSLQKHNTNITIILSYILHIK